MHKLLTLFPFFQLEIVASLSCVSMMIPRVVSGNYLTKCREKNQPLFRKNTFAIYYATAKITLLITSFIYNSWKSGLQERGMDQWQKSKEETCLPENRSRTPRQSCGWEDRFRSPCLHNTGQSVRRHPCLDRWPWRKDISLWHYNLYMARFRRSKG